MDVPGEYESFDYTGMNIGSPEGAETNQPATPYTNPLYDIGSSLFR